LRGGTGKRWKRFLELKFCRREGLSSFANVAEAGLVCIPNAFLRSSVLADACKLCMFIQ
jgi:hypothetical protein